MLQTRKHAGLLCPFPLATQVLPDGQVASSPAVHALLQYPPSVQGWLMHSWLPQSEAVVQASPTVAPQPLSKATTGMVSPIIRRKIVPLASATAKSSTLFWRCAILLCAGASAGLKAASDQEVAT